MAAMTEHARAEVAGKLEQVIAAQLRHYRTSQGLSSAELASRTGMSKAMISKIETASTSCSLTTLQRLAILGEGGIPVCVRSAEQRRHWDP